MGTQSARNRLGATGALESRPVGFLGRVRDVTVDADGVTARAPRETVMDMLVDGRRVYSFWLHRDGSRVGGGIGGRLQSRWRVPWPRTLQEFLDGTARFTVVVHETGEQVFDDEVTLGSGLRAGSRSSTATDSRSASTSPGAAS